MVAKSKRTSKVKLIKIFAEDWTELTRRKAYDREPYAEVVHRTLHPGAGRT
jgi:hypothetical protein